MILSQDPAAIKVFSPSMARSEISADAPLKVAMRRPSKVLQILTNVSSAPVMIYLQLNNNKFVSNELMKIFFNSSHKMHQIQKYNIWLNLPA